LAWFIATAILALCIGYGVGVRRARSVKNRVLLQLNTRSLELLDARSALSQSENHAIELKHKSRVIELLLSRIQVQSQRISNQQIQLERRDKKHFIELSKMRLQAVEARSTADKATALARKATARLKRVEQASPTNQTIVSQTPYSSSDPFTVSTVS